MAADMRWKFNEHNPVGRFGRLTGAAMITLHNIIGIVPARSS
jgi:hypothetical protein